jgi:hypothetical protein
MEFGGNLERTRGWKNRVREWFLYSVHMPCYHISTQKSIMVFTYRLFERIPRAKGKYLELHSK